MARDSSNHLIYSYNCHDIYHWEHVPYICCVIKSMGSPDSDGEEGWPQQLLPLWRDLPRECFALSPNDEQRECSWLQFFSEIQSVKLWALSLCKTQFSWVYSSTYSWASSEDSLSWSLLSGGVAWIMVTAQEVVLGTIARKQGWLAVVFKSVKGCVGSFKMPIPWVSVGSSWKGKWGNRGVLISG